ncbi:hypothetical protein AB0L10_45565, partial [Streptomyces flaveolus]|uniref:hypothetical protein n=1 Tax=Streptomyces flaveolus TaxID=67297 RepID=UPI0034268E47
LGCRASATKWPEIYDANQSVLEPAAHEHPGPPVFGTSDHGHWIFPGTRLTIPGTTCKTAPQIPPSTARPQVAPELPEIQFGEAAKRCALAIGEALGKKLLAESLKADVKANPDKPPLLPKNALRVVGIAGATNQTIQAVVELKNGADINVFFDSARAVSAWLTLIENTPFEKFGRVGTPVLVCAQAGLYVDQQLAIRVAAKIRASLGLPPLQKPTQ